MASPITFRLDPELRRRVSRIARQRKMSTSHLLREAVETWVEKQENTPPVYEAIKDLIGSVQGADPTLSTNTGKRMRELLHARYRQK